MRILFFALMCFLGSLCSAAADNDVENMGVHFVDAPEKLKISCKSKHWRKFDKALSTMFGKMKLPLPGRPGASKKIAKAAKKVSKDKHPYIHIDDDDFAGTTLVSVYAPTCSDAGKGAKFFAGLAYGMGALATVGSGGGDVPASKELDQVFSQGISIHGYKNYRDKNSNWVIVAMREEWSDNVEKKFSVARDLMGNVYEVDQLDKRSLADYSSFSTGTGGCTSYTCFSSARTSVRVDTKNIVEVGIVIPIELMHAAANKGKRGLAIRFYGEGASKDDYYIFPSPYINAFLRALSEVDVVVSNIEL